MNILPAIDLKDGNCVRLYKGNFDTVHKVAENPTYVANVFAKAGAKIIHVVDLDGALNGVRKNSEIVRKIAETEGVKVELGGGIRTMSDIDTCADLGVWRFVIGSAAVTDSKLVEDAVNKYGERIAVGIDAKDGIVRTHGWVEDSGINALEFAKKMEKLGVQTIIYTDIETDGTLSGPPVGKLKKLREELSLHIVASGGISKIEDIDLLKGIGIDSVIIGKAYYTGAIDIREAVRRAGVQC